MKIYEQNMKINLICMALYLGSFEPGLRGNLPAIPLQSWYVAMGLSSLKASSLITLSDKFLMYVSCVTAILTGIFVT